jgi:hypothetical protein
VPEATDMKFRESVTAFKLQDFEIGIDVDGGLVIRLTHTEDGVRQQRTYAVEFEQGLRFISAFVMAAERAEKFRDVPETKQLASIN